MSDPTPTPSDLDPSDPDPSDPRNYAHHYVIRKIGERPRVRAFHVSLNCEQINPVPEGSEVVDAGLAGIQLLNLGPCAHCTNGVRTSDAPTIIENVIATIRRNPHTRPTSAEITEVIVADLMHHGYRISKARKGNLPDRGPVSPLEMFVEDRSPLADDAMDAADGVNAPREPASEPHAAASEPAIGRNPEVVVVPPGGSPITDESPFT